MPSSAVFADEGVKAVKAGKYEEGIEKLTEALKERPAPLWLLERSKAHLRTGDFDHALHDAERALRVAFDRANRDMMVEAQIRRAVTYFRLKQFADADICAFWAIRLCEGARASEDDGQLGKVDADGEYAVTLKEVSEAHAEKNNNNKQDGLAAAMGGGGGRSKETQWKNQAFSWRLQALTQLEKLPLGDSGRKVGVKEKYPNPPKELPTKKIEAKPTPVDVDDEVIASKTATGTAPGGADEASRKATWEELWAQYRAIHAKNDIRSSFYQTDTTLNVDFFVKNVPKDEFQVHAQTDSVSLNPIPNTHTGQISLYLYGKIKPDETKYTVKSMKIELALKKETPGKWPTLRKENSELVDNIALASFPAPSFNQFYGYVTSLGYQHPKDLHLNGSISEDGDSYKSLLEKLSSGLKSTTSAGDKVEAVPASATATASAKPTAEPTRSDAKPTDSSTTTTSAAPLAGITNNNNSSGPAYPTSSKKGPKDWDKIDVEDEEGEDKDGGGGDGGDVNSFFQQLYKNADADTRRAMMKSYVESNGTSLSTSWSEAQDKTYETLPPDGSEVKKW